MSPVVGGSEPPTSRECGQNHDAQIAEFTNGRVVPNQSDPSRKQVKLEMLKSNTSGSVLVPNHLEDRTASGSSGPHIYPVGIYGCQNRSVREPKLSSTEREVENAQRELAELADAAMKAREDGDQLTPAFCELLRQARAKLEIAERRAGASA